MGEAAPQNSDQDAVEPSPAATSKRGSIRIGAIVALAVAIGFIVWAVVGGSGNGDSEASPTEPAAVGTGPVALSLGGLKVLATANGEPIYWVGPRSGRLYELRQTTDASVYLRYLPSGVKAGDPAPQLTISTYPLADAYAVTKTHVEGENTVSIPVGDGAVAFAGQDNRTSAYVAFEGSDFQIEVYDPTPGVARALVERGAVTAVPAGQPGAVKAVTLTELRALSTELAQPIYWDGPEAGSTYEYTQTADGSIYVRYLPEGTEVGDPEQLRTIGTYPFSDAYEQTKALGAQAGMELVELDDGGIGVFSEATDATQG